MKTLGLLLAILFSIAVAACGGGGGYGGGSTGGTSGYTISGMISGGTANPSHSGVTVNLTGAATQIMTTSAGGSYSFTGLANGSYTVTPTFSGATFTPASAPVAVYLDNPSNINFMERP